MASEPCASREMTLQEWVYRLPPCHAARKEYEKLRKALEEIARLAEIRSDGAEDASPGDRACGVILDVAEAALGERRG